MNKESIQQYIEKDVTPEGQYVRVAACTPSVAVASPSKNKLFIEDMYKEAAASNPEIVAFPELAITGYTAENLLQQKSVLAGTEKALTELAEATSNHSSTMIVGAPLSYKGALYNCAIVLQGGEIKGAVPKTHLPNYNEFYEKRYFQSGAGIEGQEIEIDGATVPFGTDILFDTGNTVFGVEVCEDLWAPLSPSTMQTLAGAELTVNLSASNEIVGKRDYRRQLVAAHAAKTIAAYLYVSAGPDESTASTVFGGHNLAVLNGSTIIESPPLSMDPHITMADFDMDYIRHERINNVAYNPNHALNYRTIDVRASGNKTLEDLFLEVDRAPHLPKTKDESDRRMQEVIDIASTALASNMRASGMERLVLGLSGGLDSTIAAIFGVNAMKKLGLPASNVYSYGMPGFASSSRTQGNAEKLAEALGLTHEVIPIEDVSSAMLGMIGHNTETQDVTYENVQARARTFVLMSKANQLERATVMGTGDMSEIALGWCTFNGDHMSMYNPNSGIFKTQIQHLISWAADRSEFSKARDILLDIVDTPISPELTSGGEDEVDQKTEDIVGPYELHDFLLIRRLRRGEPLEVAAWHAMRAFDGDYSASEIAHWAFEHNRRFTRQQFKRQSAPDGPKIGTVNLSQTGDWRMPPNADTDWY